MTAASPSPSNPKAPSGIAITADGAEASALTALHIERLEERGLDVELLEKLGVRASNRLGGDPCISIPFFEDGAQVGTKYRTLPAKGGKKKFTQDTGSKQILWNYDCLQDASLEHEPIIITEGELDAIAAIQCGFPRTTSVPGGALKEEETGDLTKKFAFVDHAKPLLKGDIILAMDADGPGANLMHALSHRIGRARCKWLRYPEGCKDLNEVLEEHGEEVVRQVIREAQYIKVEGVFKMSELPPVAMPRAHDCGMVGLVNHYKIRTGDLVVVSGLPGHGKTSFVNEVVCRMASVYGWNATFASFEQNPQIDHRRALRSFHINKLEVHMSDAEKARADAWIDKHFSFIVPDEDDDVTLDWLLERAAAAVIRYGSRIVVVDPWNEMDHDRPPDMSLTEYVGFAIRQLRKFARKYNVHLIVVAHPAKMRRNQDGTYPVPSLQDISDSAHWSNKADLGVIIHRPDLLNDPVSWIRIVKSRYHNAIGRPGEIKGNWCEDRTRYTITDDGAGMNEEAK
jgi:twinkle protein